MAQRNEKASLPNPGPLLLVSCSSGPERAHRASYGPTIDCSGGRKNLSPKQYALRGECRAVEQSSAPFRTVSFWVHEP